jgi:hypothetical protein
MADDAPGTNRSWRPCGPFSKGDEVQTMPMSAEEVRRVVGPVADDTLLAILKCAPTVEELEVVASYLRGEGSMLSREGHRLSGKVAEIHDLLSADALYAENNE